jgi:hypothetical protein
LELTPGSANLSIVWSAYPDNDPTRPAPGFDPVELVVDGETFVVTRRAGSPGTYDFDWTSHPASYGFTIGANAEWRPDEAELTAEIRSFLSEVDPETGFLPD